LSRAARRLSAPASGFCNAVGSEGARMGAGQHSHPVDLQ
jgi:hypothetical protein